MTFNLFSFLSFSVFKHFQPLNRQLRPTSFSFLSGSRTTACDPHTLGGNHFGEQRGVDKKHSTTTLGKPLGKNTQHKGSIWVATKRNEY